MVGFGAALSLAQFAFEYTGGKFSGFAQDAEVDEYERKEQLRRNRRRPIEQTLQEMGEGRGTSHHPPAVCEGERGRNVLNIDRYLRSWIPRKTAREAEAELWHRCPGDVSTGLTIGFVKVKFCFLWRFKYMA